MTSISTTLRPGLLVGLSTSIKGNVQYRKETVVDDHFTEDGARKAEWLTERTVIDPKEHETATKVRAKARSIVGSVCSATAFGLLCPEVEGDKLTKAIADARQICEDFNATARVSRITFYAITGRIAPDDVQAVKAINGEVRELLSDMAAGIEKIDVKAIRDAADRARLVGTMLTPEAQARISDAIEAARAAAKKIVAAGEQAATFIDKRTLATLAEARTAFLDLDPATDVIAPVTAGRSLDLAPEDATVAAPRVIAPKTEV